jgi:hypothetical protein
MTAGARTGKHGAHACARGQRGLLIGPLRTRTVIPHNSTEVDIFRLFGHLVMPAYVSKCRINFAVTLGLFAVTLGLTVGRIRFNCGKHEICPSRTCCHVGPRGRAAAWSGGGRRDGWGDPPGGGKDRGQLPPGMRGLLSTLMPFQPGLPAGQAERRGPPDCLGRRLLARLWL